MRMGINTTGRWIKKVIYYLFNKVKSKGFLVSLIGSLSDDNAWIIDTGASRHMIGEIKRLHTLSKDPSSHAVELGDNKIYDVRGLGSTSLKLENGSKLHLNNILYVPSLKINFIYISCLEDKGDRVDFDDGKLLVWGKYSSIDKVRVIGFREGNLYIVITPTSSSFGSYGDQSN